MVAQRILAVLPTLIGKDQVGFIKGRQVTDGTNRILNTLSRMEYSKSPAIFLSLDVGKAFDRIHWGFIFKTLSKFSFGGNIVTAISALYSSPLARVLTNGLL